MPVRIAKVKNIQLNIMVSIKILGIQKSGDEKDYERNGL